MAREMKDSGIEWIGEIPADWNIVRIGTQYTERKTKVSDTEYPPLSVTMKGIVPQLATAAKTDAHDDRKLVCKGDFAINSRSDRRGSCGISAYDGSVSLINTILCPRDEMNPEYYDWLFHSTMFSDEFYKWGHGIVDDLWTTNWQDMKRIFIPEPALEEQAKIAEQLNIICAEIDLVIEQTKATIEEYKKLKQSVITESVTKGIRGDRPMKDSGIEWIGEIPAEWSMQKMNRICSTITDYVASGSFASLAENVQYLDEPDYAMLIRTMDVSAKGYTGKPVYINKHAYDFLSNSNLFGGEIILPNIGASVGDIYIVPKLYERMSLAPNAIMIKTVISDKYVYYYYCGLPGRLSLLDIAQSTAQPKFNKTDFRQLKIPVPGHEEQEEIVSYLDQKCAEIDTLIAKKTALLEEMETYKKSVIYEYVTGKKEVQ